MKKKICIYFPKEIFFFPHCYLMLSWCYRGHFQRERKTLPHHLHIHIFLFFFLNFIFKLYNIVLVLPYIKMNPPQAYMCSPSQTLLHPPSPYHPSGSSQCTSPKHPVSCIESGLATHFIYDIIYISMPFSQIIPPSPSPTESKRLFYTSVSLLLSSIQGYCYHLSKFHIYMHQYAVLVFFFLAYFTLYNRLQFHPPRQN